MAAHFVLSAHLSFSSSDINCQLPSTVRPRIDTLADIAKTVLYLLEKE
jgi:hypothetical protein